MKAEKKPAFREVLVFWLQLGCIGFGGPAAQIALMHREVVERRRWISEADFSRALDFCMLLPGPEAQQLATWLGWRLHGKRGGIAAGASFVLPAAFLLLALSWLYMASGHLPWVADVFRGLAAAVVALVFDAVPRLGRRALKTSVHWILAAVTFVALQFFQAPFVGILAVAALAGWMSKRAPGGVSLPSCSTPPWRETLATAGICLALWWTPVFGVAAWLGWESVPARMGLFFSQAALVTFGGAYAVLPYVAREAVETHGWLSAPQMISGLALAETTPGPLIMVLQFVGFVGGWQNPGTLPPAAAALICAGLTTWVTFLPSFLFILTGGPYAEKFSAQPSLAGALSGITAAVVGVVLSLAVDFTRHALWPGWAMDWFTGAVALAAFFALRKYPSSLLPVIALCGLAGWLAGFLPGFR
ncbi:MAG: chromate efflux transporter [Spartobacteria bacterium]